MRQPTRRATRRARTQESQDVGRFSVVAPRFVRAGSDSAGTAAALAGALGIAGRIAPVIDAERTDRTRAQAAADFQLGDIDEDLRERSEVYRRSITRMESRAGWIEDETEFDEALRSLQLEDLEPEEQSAALDRALDDLYRSKYDGLDDSDMADFLLPQMERYRAEKQQELLTEQQRVFRERQMSAFQTVTRDAIAAAREAAQQAAPDAEPFEITASDTFDYAGLHAELRAQFTGGEANAIFFEILKDEAIRSGDPDLLRNIPDRWDDGTPSITSIPSFNEQVLNAEARAENQRVALQNAHTTANENAVEAAIDQGERDAAMAILSGQEPGQYLAELAALGASGSTILGLQKSWQTIRDDQEERAANPQQLTLLQARAYVGQLDTQGVLDAFSEGELGRGQAASTEASKLLRIVSDRARTDDRQFDQQVSGYQSSIRRFYTDSGIIKNPALSLVQAQAMEAFHVRTVVNGENPSEAYLAVREQFDSQWDLVSGGGSSNSDASLREQAVRAFATGELDAQGVIDAGVTAAELLSLNDRGQLNLSPERLNELLDRME